MTPEEALAALKDGNGRFTAGRMQERDLMGQVRDTSGGQRPFAAVLGCMDSRVPPELVFDQGIGDIFALRIAGNIASREIIGGLEFATEIVGARLIVVLGHTHCGAVMGACDRVQLGHLSVALDHLAPAIRSAGEVAGDRGSTNAAFVRAVTEANVRLTVEALTGRSEVLRNLVRDRRLRVTGALYDVSSGEVSFFRQAPLRRGGHGPAGGPHAA